LVAHEVKHLYAGKVIVDSVTANSSVTQRIIRRESRIDDSYNYQSHIATGIVLRHISVRKKTMPIDTRVDLKNQVTVHTVKGKASFDDAVATIRDFYSTNPTSNVVWDFREGTLVALSSKEIESIAELTSALSKNRTVGKTAGIVARDVDFGISRMFQSLVEVKGYRPEVRVFHDEKEALDWIIGK
jgi:hypothetical protein